MYPRRPRRVASERGRVATCCHRLGNVTHTIAPASGRLTRSRAETRGHGVFLELACAHLNHIFCIREKWPDRAKHLLSRPLLCRPKGVSVCSVVKKVPLPSGLHVGETARKPTSKPLSVPPCLRLLRVNWPEANRTPRAEGGAGTSRAKPSIGIQQVKRM